MNQQSEHITTIINEKVVPHNGKSITKIAVSPQSKYVVTYSQEVKSFVGWHINEEDKSFKNYTKWFINDDEEDESFIGCTKGLVRWFTKDRQENYSFIGFIMWALIGDISNDNNDDDDDDDDSGPLIFDDKVQSYKLFDLKIFDFKVSDEKIIMYEGSNGSAIIYDMKNGKEITLHSSFKKYKFDIPHYKYTNFLTNGDLATYNIIESKGCNKPVIIIYTFKKNWYELDEMNIDFGGITNDVLWMLSNNTILILVLFTFQYRKILLKVDVDIKMMKLRFFKSLVVISIDGIYYIYSNRMDFLIKSITETDLKSSIKCNNLLKTFFETDDNSNYSDVRFIFNDQKVFGVFYEKPWIINMKLCDLEAYILKDNSINDIDSQDLINEIIFYCIENQLIESTEDEDEFMINYVIPNLINHNEKQNKYYTRSKRDDDEIILETFVNNTNSSQDEMIFTCNIKLRSENLKHITVDYSTYILYDETELHIYTFNVKSKKIKLQSYDIKFLKYAMNLYNKIKQDTLEVEEIKELARPTNNDELKKQWVLYAIGQKYFLVNYGEKLLKSAIKQNNIVLIESIYNKILEYFRKDPKNNIYILSLLCVSIIFGIYINNIVLFIFFLCIINHPYIIKFFNNKTKPRISFMVPFPCYVKYPQEYNWLKELFKPQSSPFTRTQNNELYKTWNGEAIIRMFGKYYYTGIWVLFILYLICFTLATFPTDILNKEVRKKLFFFQLFLDQFIYHFKVRQFIWSPIRWLSDIWNFFDLSAYLVPVLTSLCWINSYIDGEITEYTQAISISCLLLDIKLLIFLRAFESIGIYFAIIIRVAKRIISFLFIIFIIILGFAHAFFILLKPKSNISESKQGNLNDPNNPWLSNNRRWKYHSD
ncbi:hypothetical protein RclHR1_20270002 [Rhizophagus clarus]|uniref:Ion transport domain-containing protein n=1 Tax=Rhizophagus clarus TaxID=94130 RepID=A0A2Z6RJN3_9GLOM|nr:hypothetical protein RclHR1_20270002 [Rhizophagus clarus]